MARPRSNMAEIPPDVLDAYRLEAAGRKAEAETRYREILRAQPSQTHALHQLGLLCRERGQHAEALEFFLACIKSDRTSANALANCGLVLLDLNRPEDALVYFDRALVLQPRAVPVLYNRGHTLLLLGREEEALRTLDRVLAIDPTDVEQVYARANALRELRRCEEALAGYARALALAPDRADIHMDEALTFLRLGDFRAGWPKYEWRWRKSGTQFSQPIWDGEADLCGKIILLHAEQGHGDTLQFARYAPLVAARGARVVLEVQPALRTLMESLAGPERVIAQGDQRPLADGHCPLMSLPRAFGTDIGSVPANVPYVSAPAGRTAIWREKLAGPKARVGLAWAGSSAYVGDRKRSIPLRLLAPLLAVGDFDFIGLQREVPAQDAPGIEAAPALKNLGLQLTDFAETAAVISQLDLVISVDTAVAHLAGALGKPVWLLLPTSPDFRWMLDREDSPWYPSARLFRQSRSGDWAGVIARLHAELSLWPRDPSRSRLS